MVRGEGNGTKERWGVQGQVGEEVLMEVVGGYCGSMVEAYVQVDMVERLGVLLEGGSDQYNVCRVLGALEEHLTGGC
jgi:hypothetical protein